MLLLTSLAFMIIYYRHNRQIYYTKYRLDVRYLFKEILNILFSENINIW